MVENTELGELIECRKARYYAGKSTITNKSLWQICYHVYFYNPTKKPIGYIASNKPYTMNKSFNNQAELKDFLKINGFEECEIIDR
ncbi:hypothetical protein [Sporomusa sp. KB1]|jgi:hypothetical protein|uniref:hypothetical protein n=1 Tax=Sporomusa sp. KB1 TaxID=943346 RepID=UPI00119F4180|nr:hypothetical protein [Sporomusa sp. KB1]